jgi:hypothetical protein
MVLDFDQQRRKNGLEGGDGQAPRMGLSGAMLIACPGPINQ